MCSPMMLIGGIATAGMFQQAEGAKNASVANQQAGYYQAAVEKNKATVAEYQAKDAIARGQQAQARIQLRGAQVKGAQRARLAAAGFDLEEGTAANLLADTEYLMRHDVLTEQDNAEKEAWAYMESAKTGQSNAEFLRRRAASEDPDYAYNTTLLGGVGQVASMWYGMSKTGMR